MTSPEEDGTGIAVSSPHRSSSRLASGSSHPLQNAGSSSLDMANEEQGPLLEGNRGGPRPSFASRAHTFAGEGGRSDDASGWRNSGDSAAVNGTPSSWGHPEARGRHPDDRKLSGGGRRTGSNPPRLSTLSRTVSQSGPALTGAGYDGHPSSRLSVDSETGVGGIQAWRVGAEGETPLERTIDAIGMGRYQYAVLILSGFGWAADNMWLQGVAIVLPRVQDEWQIGDQWIGLVSSCTFAGMMVGALAWGSYSDSFGRKNAFNATLLITSVFGLLSSLSPSFPLLCLCLFLLGTGVGGSMPTDGTIFLEALPKRNHYLLTALSVFFAAGSVISSTLGLIIVPGHSCGGAKVCDVADNKGWRWLLGSLGGLTFLFVVARLVFFSLLESPKFLVSAGRHEEARSVLQRIADFNGAPKRFKLSDVHDQDDAAEGSQPRPEGLRTSLSRWKSWKAGRSESMDWQDGSQERQRLIAGEQGQDEAEASPPSGAAAMPWSSGWGWVPLSWRPWLEETGKRYAQLFTPHWAKTTTLVWSIWTVFTLAYTMVNIFLPKYLENRSGREQSLDQEPDAATRRLRMESVMQEFLFYSLASLPGSLLGAYLIETPLGRIKSMAISTSALAISLLAFAFSKSSLAVITSSCSISLFAAVSYAVIYSYSPEVFDTNLRGTASGTASALSRFAGILAPLLAGALMNIDANLPLFLGFGLFAVTVWLQLSLPYETKRAPETQPSGLDVPPPTL